LLAGPSALRRLNLSGCALGARDARELAEALPGCSLAEVKLSGNAFDAEPQARHESDANTGHLLASALSSSRSLSRFELRDLSLSPFSLARFRDAWAAHGALRSLVVQNRTDNVLRGAWALPPPR
jgi:hypothetical protein